MLPKARNLSRVDDIICTWAKESPAVTVFRPSLHPHHPPTQPVPHCTGASLGMAEVQAEGGRKAMVSRVGPVTSSKVLSSCCSLGTWSCRGEPSHSQVPSRTAWPLAQSWLPLLRRPHVSGSYWAKMTQGSQDHEA